MNQNPKTVQDLALQIIALVGENPKRVLSVTVEAEGHVIVERLKHDQPTIRQFAERETERVLYAAPSPRVLEDAS